VLGISYFMKQNRRKHMVEQRIEGPTHPVAELIAQGMTVMRVENESQQAMATLKPRNEAKVYMGAIEELQLAPQFAKTAWYSIPYKDGDKTVFVEGPSIKAAMALARRWGNCANAARITDNLEDRIIVEGVFMDYETNLRTLRTVSVAKKAWNTRLKQVLPLREDRLNMAIQSGMSKATRNAILASLPASLVDSYVAAAKKIAIGKGPAGSKEKTIKERVDEAIKKFITMGTTENAVQLYINGQAYETDEDLLAGLMGLWTSINEGQVSVEDVFGVTEAAPAALSGAIPSAADLLGGKGSAATPPAVKK
jgi:hypothetical protein